MYILELSPEELSTIQTALAVARNTYQQSPVFFENEIKETTAVLEKVRHAPAQGSRPPCYLEEPDNPYPLCIGRGMPGCKECCLWVDFDCGEGQD